LSRIVVAEKISPGGIDRLRGDGHEIVDAVGWPRVKLLAALGEADVLLVRSGTKVDAELLAAAPRLSIVGRAGVGVDNVDMPAATKRGVLVINSPTGNVVSAVEHTFALLLALLRRIVPAAASLAAGKWERSKFSGVELYEKTLGARARLLGPDHLSTLRSASYLARAYRKAGRLADAMPLFEDVFKQRRLLLGDSHLATLRSANYLAAAYSEAGRLDEAIPLYQQTIAGCAEALGNDHALTRQVHRNFTRAQELVAAAAR